MGGSKASTLPHVCTYLQPLSCVRVCRYNAVVTPTLEAPAGALRFLNLLARCPTLVVIAFALCTIPFVVFLSTMKVTARYYHGLLPLPLLLVLLVLVLVLVLLLLLLLLLLVLLLLCFRHNLRRVDASAALDCCVMVR